MIMEFPSEKEFAERVANDVLDDMEIEGKSIREWINEMAKQVSCEDAISQSDVIDAIGSWMDSGENCLRGNAERYLIDRIKALPSVTPQEPSNDMVSRGVFEQVMWERDVAIDQLKQLGYGFGEKPKTGHWIFVDKAHEHAHCSECDYGNVDLLDGRPHNYCPNCGARMVEPQESEEQA